MLIYQVLITDKESRKAYKEAEWKLNLQIFKKALKHLQFTPYLDCFATGINSQLDRYVSYKPDPHAFLVDAFTANWQLYNCYLFSLFSVMGLVLRKIQIDQAEVILVAPLWPTQPWCNTYQDPLIKTPYFVHPHPGNLILPNQPEAVHPLWSKLRSSQDPFTQNQLSRSCHVRSQKVLLR